uniref:Uncharacterized protein n=1 Tax=marine sediment metagenome TaxID=412755 RepID=A0A0F9GI47_9ZZZZ
MKRFKVANENDDKVKSLIDNDLIKQAYELVKGVKLSLLLTGNLYIHKGTQPKILTGEQISLPEKGEQLDVQ